MSRGYGDWFLISLRCSVIAIVGHLHIGNRCGVRSVDGDKCRLDIIHRVVVLVDNEVAVVGNVDIDRHTAPLSCRIAEIVKREGLVGGEAAKYIHINLHSVVDVASNGVAGANHGHHVVASAVGVLAVKLPGHHKGHIGHRRFTVVGVPLVGIGVEWARELIGELGVGARLELALTMCLVLRYGGGVVVVACNESVGRRIDGRALDSVGDEHAHIGALGTPHLTVDGDALGHVDGNCNLGCCMLKVDFSRHAFSGGAGIEESHGVIAIHDK